MANNTLAARPSSAESETSVALSSAPARRLHVNERQLESAPIHESDEALAYDHMVRKHQGLLNLPFVDAIGRAGVTSGRLLDIGCGPGWIPIELARRFPKLEIQAVDPSSDMLERARAHARQAGVADRIRFENGDAAALPFEADSFDAVISNYVLHHMSHPEVFLNEAARVARLEARILIKDLLRPPRWKRQSLLLFSRIVLGYSPLQLKLYAESMDAGLTMIEARAAVEASRLRGARIKHFRHLDYLVTF